MSFPWVRDGIRRKVAFCIGKFEEDVPCLPLSHLPSRVFRAGSKPTGELHLPLRKCPYVVCIVWGRGQFQWSFILPRPTPLMALVSSSCLQRSTPWPFSFVLYRVPSCSACHSSVQYMAAHHRVCVEKRCLLHDNGLDTSHKYTYGVVPKCDALTSGNSVMTASVENVSEDSPSNRNR